MIDLYDKLWSPITPTYDNFWYEEKEKPNENYDELIEDENIVNKDI